MFASPDVLRSENGRINFLLLGLGGPKNEPAGLTDTIIFASVDVSKKNIILVSIPRDIWVPELEAKINSTYYYGNQQDGVGLDWTKKHVSQIVGQPIHYEILVSFDTFVGMVDLLGGVDVVVDKSFTDERYPIHGKEDDLCGGDPRTLCRYEKVTFWDGFQHFDGIQALKFARSRHATGGEGSDFARSKRQQKIIMSIKDKVLTPDFIFNPEKVSKTLQIASNSVEIDIPQSHLAPLIKLALEVKDANVRPEAIVENGKRGFLINPPISAKYGKQWVLVPRADTWQPVQEWVDCLLENKSCSVEEFTKEIVD